MALLAHHHAPDWLARVPIVGEPVVEGWRRLADSRLADLVASAAPYVVAVIVWVAGALKGFAFDPRNHVWSGQYSANVIDHDTIDVCRVWRTFLYRRLHHDPCGPCTHNRVRSP